MIWIASPKWTEIGRVPRSFLGLIRGFFSVLLWPLVAVSVVCLELASVLLWPLAAVCVGCLEAVSLFVRRRKGG